MCWVSLLIREFNNILNSLTFFWIILYNTFKNNTKQDDYKRGFSPCPVKYAAIVGFVVDPVITYTLLRYVNLCFTDAQANSLCYK